MRSCHKCGEPAANSRGLPVCDTCRVGKVRTSRDLVCNLCGGGFRSLFNASLCHRCRYLATGKSKVCLSCGIAVDRRSEHSKCRACLGKERSGTQAPTWKGGRTVHKASGYVLLKIPDHPNARADGYVREHVVVASQMLGRPLFLHEDVHHLNGDKQDNRPENLEVLSKSEHTRKHQYMRNGNRPLTVEEVEIVRQRAKLNGYPPGRKGRAGSGWASVLAVRFNVSTTTIYRAAGRKR